jgi:AP-2 complex subunit beta-1
MIWIIGQYAERVENAEVVLESFADTFKEEQPEVSWRAT